jgi:hypothetical protein
MDKKNTVDVMFTDAVKAIQEHRGSRRSLLKMEKKRLLAEHSLRRSGPVYRRAGFILSRYRQFRRSTLYPAPWWQDRVPESTGQENVGIRQLSRQPAIHYGW